MPYRGGRMENLSNVIGERIRELRKIKSISQEELAFQVDLHYTFLGKIERGEKKVSLERLFKITSALNISLEEFFSTIDSKVENDAHVMNQIIEVLKTRSLQEQVQLLDIIKIFNKMLENKSDQ